MHSSKVRPLTFNLFSDQIKAPCTRWDPSAASHQYNVLLVEFLPSMCTVVPTFRFTKQPTIFFLARQLHFTCFFCSAFSVPLHPVLHHLPFMTGCLLLQQLIWYMSSMKRWRTSSFTNSKLVCSYSGEPADLVVADMELDLLDDLPVESRSSHWGMHRLKLITKKL